MLRRLWIPSLQATMTNSKKTIVHLMQGAEPFIGRYIPDKDVPNGDQSFDVVADDGSVVEVWLPRSTVCLAADALTPDSDSALVEGERVVITCVGYTDPPLEGLDLSGYLFSVYRFPQPTSQSDETPMDNHSVSLGAVLCDAPSTTEPAPEDPEPVAAPVSPVGE